MTNDQLVHELNTVKSTLARLIDANSPFDEGWSPHLNGALMLLLDAVRGVQERYVQEDADQAPVRRDTQRVP